VVQAGLECCLCKYKSRNIVYMVGQNDTCNDGLPTCNVSLLEKAKFLAGGVTMFSESHVLTLSCNAGGPKLMHPRIAFQKILNPTMGNRLVCYMSFQASDTIPLSCLVLLSAYESYLARTI
jgi:hypothetical protein